MKEMNKGVKVFTDGACAGNPGPGGYGIIIKYNGEFVELGGGSAQTTNNEMELLGAVRALEVIRAASEIELITDSQYVVKGISEWLPGWKAKGWRNSTGKVVKNLELWKRMDKCLQHHKVMPVWVRGHAGHPENERCDQIAVSYRDKYGAGR